jgi:hypothetical protein
MQSTLTPELALRSAVSTPRPVWPKLPTAEAFFPLVLLVTTILPGLFAWYFGELTPRMSLWGLWGLRLLHGFDGLPAEFPDTLAPLYAWFNAAALAIPFPERLWAPMLPAYLFALISLGAVFWLGKLWYGSGTGLLTCFFLGLNPLFIGPIQNGDSATAKLAFAIIGLLCYAQHLRSKAEAFSVWIIPGGIAFGGLLLTAGWYALVLPIIGAMHIHLHEAQQRDDLQTTIRQSMLRPTMLGGLLVLLVGVGLAHARRRTHGPRSNSRP